MVAVVVAYFTFSAVVMFFLPSILLWLVINCITLLFGFYTPFLLVMLVMAIPSFFFTLTLPTLFIGSIVALFKGE